MRTAKLFATSIALVATFGPLVSSGPSPFWPRFHSARGDNVARDEVLFEEFPSGGPTLLWRYSGCGRGFSSIVTAEGKIFTAGDHGPDEFVIALDLNGRPVWKRSNGPSWRRATPGSRSTPTYYKGMLYHLNPFGRLAALKAADGSEVWSVDLKERFGARYGWWGMSESVLVTERAVFCTPGGLKGSVVALDRKTGETLWANTQIRDKTAYSSPVLIEHKGRKQLLVLLEQNLAGIDPRTGATLWTFPHYTPYGVNVISPLYYKGHVFVTGGYRVGSRLLELASDGKSVKLVWSNAALDNCHGGVVFIDGCLYGSGCRKSKLGFLCLRWEDGRTLWNSTEVGKVSLVAAGGLIWAVSDKGVVFLIEPDPARCRVVGRFRLPPGDKELCLAHPVIAGGVLYIRRGTDLWAYRVGPGGSER